ncbi:hypothetical protein Tco_0002603 [Tanacetum coccineum]
MCASVCAFAGEMRPSSPPDHRSSKAQRTNRTKACMVMKITQWWRRYLGKCDCPWVKVVKMVIRKSEKSGNLVQQTHWCSTRAGIEILAVTRYAGCGGRCEPATRTVSNDSDYFDNGGLDAPGKETSVESEGVRVLLLHLLD